MHIIRPKHHFDIRLGEIPYFYLIGPVLGGGDWQHEMCLALERVVGECVIAVPNRWTDDHPLAQYFVGNVSDEYESQTHWEQLYIEHAIRSTKACLVAYLAGESVANPRSDGKPYGIDTYGEMNYFRGRMESWGPRTRKLFPLVLGVDERYPYWKTLKKNIDHSYGGEYPYSSSVRALSIHAMEMVFR